MYIWNLHLYTYKTQMKSLFPLFLFGLLIVKNTQAQNSEQLLTDFYFDSSLPLLDSSGFNYTADYTLSSSSWAIDSFPESVVFQKQLSYENTLDPSTSYDIRIGKGGQLYSFRGVFGESVPPQWVNPNWVQPSYGGGHSYAPWVDEIWQLVSVDGSIHNPPDSSYFIHQAGVYLKTPSQTQPFYSPILAEYFDPDDQSYSVVNWGQQAHTEDLQNINHDAGLLYYTKYTNKGKGIIQVDNMIYNFGQDNMNFLNVPWGGVRNSSLDHFFISTPTHDYNLTTGLYGQTPVIQTASTGGWVAWSNEINGNSATLGMAHPTTTNTYGNKFRYGDAGNLSNANNLRDYHVFEMIRQPTGNQLGFGKSMSFRYFYVLGASVDSVKNTIVQYDLISHGLDTAYVANIYDVDSLRYSFAYSTQSLSASVTGSESGLLLRTSPFSDSYPLFKISSNESVDALSSNPYYFSEFAYDGTTTAIKLLGFLDSPTHITVIQDTICKGEDFSFSDGTVFNNLLEDTSYISSLSSSQLDWDSLVIQNLVVLPVHDEIDLQEACASYIWMDGVNYTESTNTPTVVLSNQFGCDSTVTLDLTIHDVDVQITQIDDITLQSNTSNAQYQWLDCDNTFEAINGETNQSFAATYNSNFAVIVTENNCSDTSLCIQISTVGIQNNIYSVINVYPNPTANLITIQSENIMNNKFKISDQKGRAVLMGRLKVNNTEVSLETLSKGIYTIQVEGNYKPVVIVKE